MSAQHMQLATQNQQQPLVRRRQVLYPWKQVQSIVVSKSAHPQDCVEHVILTFVFCSVSLCVPASFTGLTWRQGPGQAR